MVVARGWSWRSKYRFDLLGPVEVHVVLHMTGGTPNYDGDGAVSPPPHMFLRAGSAVAGLRAPRTATSELREWRLTGGGKRLFLKVRRVDRRLLSCLSSYEENDDCI